MVQDLSDPAPRAPTTHEHWVHRAGDDHQATQARVLAEDKRKRSMRLDVEFLGGDRSGETENVPGVRPVSCGPTSPYDN